MPKPPSRLKVLRKSWPRIYALSHRDCYLIDGRIKRRGKRFYRKTLDEAKLKAETLERERNNGGIEALTFPTELRIQAIQAASKLRAWNATITQACDHYVKFLETEQTRLQSPLISEVVKEYLAERESDFKRGDLAELSFFEIRHRARHLSKVFGPTRIADLNAQRIKNYIESFPVSARTRVNIRLRLSKLCAFAVERGWLQQNPCERVKLRVPEAPVKILSIAEIKTLLAKTQQSKFNATVMPYVLCCLFQGLRPGEAEQLKFEQITDDAIHVLGPSSKSRRTRWVETNETFSRWFAPYRKATGPIVSRNFRKEFESVRRDCGYDPDTNPWVPDVLRHCFATFWLPIHKDTGRLAHLMGNSEDTILAHYRRVVAKREAEAFWNLDVSTT